MSTFFAAIRLSAAALLASLAVASTTAGLQGAGGPAQAGETRISWEELDRVLLDRHALSDDSQFALEHLLKTTFLDWLARERGVEVPDADVSTRWTELDRDAREAGLERGLLQEVESRGLSAEAFRELLRLSIVHERLTRAALDLPPDATVTAAQQNVWIEEQMNAHGVEMLPPPWADGVAARCGAVEVPLKRFAQTLRTNLPASDVREICMQMLLVKRLHERMPDLASDARSSAIAAEVERRRVEAAANPAYKGVPLESLLRAQGMVPERFPSDPAVVAAALAQLWVDRNYGPEGLRTAYEDERQLFEERYGEAVLTHLVFLAAARNPNELQPRSTVEARKTLERIAKDIDGLASFGERARALSDDRYTRDQSGRLGWVTRGASGVPASLRDAVFEDVGSRGAPEAGGHLVGPIELENGVALLWLERHRDSPEWEEMSVHVHRELRGRLAAEVLPPESVSTFLDAP